MGFKKTASLIINKPSNITDSKVVTAHMPSMKTPPPQPPVKTLSQNQSSQPKK